MFVCKFVLELFELVPNDATEAATGRDICCSQCCPNDSQFARGIILNGPLCIEFTVLFWNIYFILEVKHLEVRDCEVSLLQCQPPYHTQLSNTEMHA